ncbi:fluoride efflux transporter FluC [Liquorilactobacillus satsumensis]|nr:CrcB family protein [Liquorilactobacillus satsumensis]MCC7666299.1 CrcB family protein [Liquorilactobacillus satsumensis]MCP9312774.1 CrcB family protein [Liquorilactobacillus satsumensis]MCP9327960.1 CrcB family protein [Liquorilactobacillus satsumensis]MCP9358404.1 CrcB family protein [Liquorilactobacillus satsumensis]MCP9359212.1 CrcB family protein [Liquorilactobacillus satsumensis]
MKENLKNDVSVICFAFGGGCLRYFFTTWLGFSGTVVVNLSGCFLLACLTYFFLTFKNFSEWLTIGLGTGLIGSYTTFSSYNLDLLKMILQHTTGEAVLYLVISILGGLLCAYCGAFCGTSLGKKLVRRRQR